MGQRDEFPCRLYLPDLPVVQAWLLSTLALPDSASKQPQKRCEKDDYERFPAASLLDPTPAIRIHDGIWSKPTHNLDGSLSARFPSHAAISSGFRSSSRRRPRR